MAVIAPHPFLPARSAVNQGQLVSIPCNSQAMARVLFITGAGGFIGKALVSKLVATGLWQIKALIRRPIEQGGNLGTSLTFIVGDLCDAETYRASLERVDTVIHLAGVTGKAAPNEYEQTNVEGTKSLLQACKKAGVGRFLHVSTIAVNYADQRYYPYAQSKARAEALVRESGIPNAIIRPTVVVGVGSPIWHTLSRMAKLPIIPLPNGGRVQLQPIDVNDLVKGIELALSEGRFEGEALDLGGAAPTSFADFIRAIHRAFYGKEPHFLYLPLDPIRALLALMEPLLRPVLPVTAGQLAVFANDSTVSPNWLHDRLKGRMRSMEETIATLVVGKAPLDAGAAAKGSAAVAPGHVSINSECDVFSRYLVSQVPTDYIRRQYETAVVARNLASDAEFSAFDRRTLRLARRHAFFTRLADAYCAIFHRHGVLRRKLILLLAILEHTAPTATRFDRPKIRGPVGIGTNLFVLGTSFGLSLIAGMLLLLPSHLLSRKQVGRKVEGSGK